MRPSLIEHLWSALNTSPLGTVAFAGSNLQVAYTSMLMGAGTIMALAGGIYLLYGKKGTVAAAATGITGVGLFIWYHYLIQQAAAGVPTSDIGQVRA